MKVFLELPWPPSNNTYYRHAGHRTYISAKGLKYIRDVCDYVSENKFPKFGEAKVKLSITLRVPDKRKRDIDNTLKAIFDAVETSGLIDDDSQIETLYLERGEILKGGRVILIIEEKHET